MNLLRSHFRKDGKPKRGFRSETEALSSVVTAIGVVAYRCDCCLKFHLGRDKSLSRVNERQS